MPNSKKYNPYTGRFAPSPTGPLHFGSLIAAVGSYCLARQAGGRWLIRMEDIDFPRVVHGAAEDILHTLERLGFEWDGEVSYQSRRLSAYETALAQLKETYRIFDCGCSRREILASAPHPGEEGPVYPGTCRNGISGRKQRSVRVRVPDEIIAFVDGIFGAVAQNLAESVGDFVLRRADGLFAYQLAVVVDDAESGVTHVVRGADLLSSTPRQIFLYRCLGLPVPAHAHLPLAIAPDGEKISKRHGAARVQGNGTEQLRNALIFLGQDVHRDLDGAAPSEILRWGAAHFNIEKVPRVGGRTIFDEITRGLTTPPKGHVTKNPSGSVQPAFLKTE
jgi:glutamyl-Q tRNA(Asp) synthetase